jgi:hypothetical protein
MYGHSQECSAWSDLKKEEFRGKHAQSLSQLDSILDMGGEEQKNI